MHWYSFPDFLPETQAGALRKVFDANQSNPLRSNPERFVWDYWHIPGEYTLLRTPAWEYFPQKKWQSFLQRLQMLAHEKFGCRHLSPVWLSNYVEGCRQEEHQDRPHGPWAFVYSLTLPPRKFVGGETFIQDPKNKNRYKTFKPDFNRLLVFNPHLPHGVRPVKNTFDPRTGRLVLHGWFTNPQPFLRGALSPAKMEEPLHSLYRGLYAMAKAFPALKGFASWQINCNSKGKVVSLDLLCSNIQNGRNTQSDKKYLAAAEALILTLSLPEAKGSSKITLPLEL